MSVKIIVADKLLLGYLPYSSVSFILRCVSRHLISYVWKVC